METEKKMLRRDEMDRKGEREKEYATQSARERDSDVFVCVVGGGREMRGRERWRRRERVHAQTRK